MNELYLDEFRRLVRGGAGTRDVHDAVDRGFAAVHTTLVDDRYVQREVNRVRQHQLSLLPILERLCAPAPTILDFGCGTGGGTVALALSEKLLPTRVVGIDANASAIAAARVRASAYDLDDRNVQFDHLQAGQLLPFDSGTFDLVVMVSVLEFIGSPSERERLLSELMRVVKPGGYLYLSSPRRGLREFHSHRLAGDFRRAPGMPWSSSSKDFRAWLAGWERIPVDALYASIGLGRRRWGRALAGSPWVGRVASVARQWNRVLARRPQVH